MLNKYLPCVVWFRIILSSVLVFLLNEKRITYWDDGGYTSLVNCAFCVKFYATLTAYPAKAYNVFLLHFPCLTAI